MVIPWDVHGFYDVLQCSLQAVSQIYRVSLQWQSPAGRNVVINGEYI